LEKKFDKIFCLGRLSRLVVLSSPALRGSGRTVLATAVASCESWGVRKLFLRAVFKGFYKNYHQHFFNLKRFPDFEFLNLKKDKNFNK